ncbi:endonuclease VII domain-containing protein [Streptomyces sp. NPDC048506]|uniref:endonuclease VII domain-containing protein n=1 Tax=Streptomyces sp. NPDC048506 TaxID=3155028 RepID=UPI00344232BC
MPDSLGKWCTGCKQQLPLTSFAADKNRRDGLQVRCRGCVAQYSAARYRRRQAALGKTVRERADAPAGYKQCRRCGDVKPHSEWHRNATASDGLSTRCKACRAVESRAGHLKRAYGLTEAEREEPLSKQYGLCPICLKVPPEHVDHDHKTGKVRGVLCFNCNTALGHLKDGRDALRRAIEYLEGKVWKPILEAPGVYLPPS